MDTECLVGLSIVEIGVCVEWRKIDFAKNVLVLDMEQRVFSIKMWTFLERKNTKYIEDCLVEN